jgi:hypothetical protein
MTLSPESITAFQFTMARRIRLAIAVIVATHSVGFAVIAWVVLSGATPVFFLVLVYLAVGWPVALVVMPVVLRRATRDAVDFLTVLAPRIRSIAPLSTQGLLLLLDNDLLFRVQPTTTFRLFVSAAGDPISPDITEASPWVRTARIRRIGQVTRTRGDPSLSAELDQIASRLGSRWARLVVLDRVRVDASNPRSPIRDALVVFPLRNPTKSGEAIAKELDSIRHLLVLAASMWPLGPPRPIS